MKNIESNLAYHEIDFLLPAQRFNINFSYITQKGLPFVREFVLRLVHLAPISATQVAAFFGFSRGEVHEAIEDLVDRGELTLTTDGRLTLTEKANGYFTELGEVPRLSLLRDSTAHLCFDLATFSCLGKENFFDKWKAGLPIKVDNDNASRSEKLVEKSFQRQFQKLLQDGLLSKSLMEDESDLPSIYTVTSVNKIKQLPLRLSVKFKVSEDGENVERDDFEILGNSDYVHGQISLEIDHLSRPSNLDDIKNVMIEIGDTETSKLFEIGSDRINLRYLEDLGKLEKNSQQGRSTFLGPIYSSANWELVQMHLAPLIKERRQSKADVGQTPFVWVAPSDPFWGKSSSLQVRFAEILNNAHTKEKRIYSPAMYLPVQGPDDLRSARQWKREFDPNTEATYGVIEGFLRGNVEILHFEGEFVVVIYHVSLPDAYPVSFPIGFVSTERQMVQSVGGLLKRYLDGNSGFDKPNNCGLLTRFGRGGDQDRR
jgi:hypothetical protein